MYNIIRWLFSHMISFLDLGLESKFWVCAYAYIRAN